MRRSHESQLVQLWNDGTRYELATGVNRVLWPSIIADLRGLRFPEHVMLRRNFISVLAGAVITGSRFLHLEHRE
jgi:hypothetical protein